MSWSTTSIGDVAQIKQGRYLAPEDMSPIKTQLTPTPVWGGNGIIGWTDKVMYEKGVPLLTCRGSNCGLVLWADGPLWVSNNAMAVTCSDESQRFIYYSLLGESYSDVITGSAQPQITMGNLSPKMISWRESGSERKAIANILGTLDDKIDLNRRMNETLEAMARAIFKDWFVDFGPTRAKMEGRPPYLAPDLWALFPDRLGDDGLPVGWEMKKIGDFIERLNVGKKYEAKTVEKTGNVPVLDQGKSGLIGYHNDEPGLSPTPEKPVIVFANHTCYMRLVMFPFSAIQNVLPFVGLGVDTLWTYFATLDKQNFIEYKGHWPDFMIHEVAVPPENLTFLFGQQVAPLCQRMFANEQDNEKLAKSRDILLPKLMTGEVRVNGDEIR